MGTDDDRRLDDELRRLARNASERHRDSITPDDIDQALAAVRSGLQGEPRRDAVGPKRTGWFVAAAAAAIAILIAGVAWWPTAQPEDRLTSVTDVDDNTATTTEQVDQTQLPATPSPATAPATRCPGLRLRVP